MQWPEYEWQELNVHALATNQLESQVQQAWSSQVSMVYRGGAHHSYNMQPTCTNALLSPGDARFLMVVIDAGLPIRCFPFTLFLPLLILVTRTRT